MTAVLDGPVTDTGMAVNADLMIRAIQNVALFASKDDTLPALCAVHLTAADGELRAEATDRYALAQERVPCGPGELDILVDVTAAVTAAKALTAALRPSKRLYLADAPSIAITTEGRYARFTLTGHFGPATSVAAEVVSGDYLRGSDGRFPDSNEEYAQECTGHITFAVAYLARIAKVTGGDSPGHTYARFTLAGPREPGIVHIGDAFRALVMPIRQAA